MFAKGIVAADEACVIAMSQGAILDSDLCDVELPAVVHSVMGFAPARLVAPVHGNEPSYVEIPNRSQVYKINGSNVSTTSFLDGSASEIAGVLFASQAVWNLEWKSEEALGLLRNPTATVPLCQGFIPTRCELWAEGTRLHHRGRCARFGPYAK